MFRQWKNIALDYLLMLDFAQLFARVRNAIRSTFPTFSRGFFGVGEFKFAVKSKNT
tara:strand:- start:1323 stop:1490 length:168 start_codon:yes stop_codon:yes gene_type:complete